MKVKIQPEKSKEWGQVRQGIFWTVFCILLALAMFEAGWILRDLQRDELTEKVYKHASKITDHEGRIIALEGPPGGKK
jgi:hypothetical protein